MTGKMFKINSNGGFQMKIGNRILSVQFGAFTYSDNNSAPVTEMVTQVGASSDTAEVAVIHADTGKFLYRYTGNEDVGAYWSMDQVLELIAILHSEKIESENMPYVGQTV